MLQQEYHIKMEERVVYTRIHQLILFFCRCSQVTLWGTFVILLAKFFWEDHTRTAYTLYYVVISSFLLFFTSFFLHNIIEWDRVMSLLKLSTGHWRCLCGACHSRRQTNRISKLKPRGLHRILANAHTWVSVPAVLAFLLLLLSTDSGTPFRIFLVISFIIGDVIFFLTAHRTVIACVESLKENPAAEKVLTKLHPPHSMVNAPHFQKTSKVVDNDVSHLKPEQLPQVEHVRRTPEQLTDKEHADDDSGEEAESFDERTYFSMARTVTPEGKQRIDGWLRLSFQQNQKHITQHIPFYPAFEAVPQVMLEPVEGTTVTIDEPVIMLYGLRFDAKRSGQTMEHDSSPIVVFAIEEV